MDRYGNNSFISGTRGNRPFSATATRRGDVTYVSGSNGSMPFSGTATQSGNTTFFSGFRNLFRRSPQPVYSNMYTGSSYTAKPVSTSYSRGSGYGATRYYRR